MVIKVVYANMIRKDSGSVMNKIKFILSAVSVLLIGAFFYTEYQKSQIDHFSTIVAKLEKTPVITTHSGTVTQVVANDNKLPDDSQAKETVSALFNAGYGSDKQVLSKVANDKVRQLVRQFLGHLEDDPAAAKKWHVSDNQLTVSQQSDYLLFFGGLSATNGDRTISYQLSGRLNAKGTQVTSLTLGHLTKGDQ